MGNTPSSYFSNTSYTVPTDPQKLFSENGLETCIFRSARSPKILLNRLPDKNLKTGYDIFLLGLQANPNGPFLGSRKLEPNGTYSDYQYETYTEVNKKILILGSYIERKKLIKERKFDDELYEPAKIMRTAGIAAKNCPEWFITDFASHAYGWTIVPLYETLGKSSLIYMIKCCELSVIFGCLDNLLNLKENLIDLKNSIGTFYVETLICFDEDISSLVQEYKDLNITIIKWFDIMNNEDNQLISPYDIDSTQVNTICYTSGTTGVPKGVILPESIFVAQVVGAFRGPLTEPNFKVTSEDSYMSYLPLAHVFERAMCLIITGKGGRIPIWRGDVSNLSDDMKNAKPTIFASVPRLFMRINDRININIEKSSKLVKYIFNYALQTKINNLHKYGITSHYLWDYLLFKEIKKTIGGNVRFMILGGAALDTDIQEKMACYFNCCFLEGYGLTETFGATFLRKSDDPFYGHIGMPLPMNEIKIHSVPEMSYYVNGDVMAGELAIRGHTVFPGYFKNSIETKNVLTKDGWFFTGDIVVRLYGSGAIKIVDRKKNIFKLAQGEYICPEKIENALTESYIIQQALIYGNTMQSYLVAIIVLDDEEGLKYYKEKNKIATSTEKLFTTYYNELYTEVENEIVRISAEKKFTKIEYVKKFLLIADKFTDKNELMTPTQKIRRKAVIELYKNELEALYTNSVTSYDIPDNFAILLVKKISNEKATAIARIIIKWLNKNKKIAPYVEQNQQNDYSNLEVALLNNEKDQLKRIKLLITVGGDGTTLWACSLFPTDVLPIILPIKLGSLSVINQVDVNKIIDVLITLFTYHEKLELKIEERSSLEVQITNNEEVIKATSINECCIERGESSSIVTVDIYVDKMYVTNIAADGVIVGTSTGSTAYNLAAGGSLVHPAIKCLLLTPICAHSLSFRPVILPLNKVITIQLSEIARSVPLVYIDGRKVSELSSGAKVVISTSTVPIKLIKINDINDSWLKTIKRSLNWGLQKKHNDSSDHAYSAYSLPQNMHEYI